jgi:hypothetical protein
VGQQHTEGDHDGERDDQEPGKDLVAVALWKRVERPRRLTLESLLSGVFLLLVSTLA